MKKLTSILLLIILTLPNVSAYDEYYWTLTDLENNVLTFWWDSTCKNIKESDILTLLSWLWEVLENEKKVFVKKSLLPELIWDFKFRI